MLKPLAVGDVIHGFAGGAFGRDHWGCVRISETGADWVRAVDEDGTIVASAEGVRSLVHLMQSRDDDSCPERENGDRCPMDDFVQLTDSGELVRVPKSDRWVLDL